LWGGFVLVVQVFFLLALIFIMKMWDFDLALETGVAVITVLAFAAMVISHSIDEWQWEFDSDPKDLRRATSWFMGLATVVFLIFTWQIWAGLAPPLFQIVLDPDGPMPAPVTAHLWWKPTHARYPIGASQHDCDAGLPLT
jgi:amino acid transporter